MRASEERDSGRAPRSPAITIAPPNHRQFPLSPTPPPTRTAVSCSLRAFALSVRQARKVLQRGHARMAVCTFRPTSRRCACRALNQSRAFRQHALRGDRPPHGVPGSGRSDDHETRGSPSNWRVAEHPVRPPCAIHWICRVSDEDDLAGLFENAYSNSL
jgi:hypothetical protein